MANVHRVAKTSRIECASWSGENRGDSDETERKNTSRLQQQPHLVPTTIQYGGRRRRPPGRSTAQAQTTRTSAVFTTLTRKRNLFESRNQARLTKGKVTSELFYMTWNVILFLNTTTNFWTPIVSCKDFNQDKSSYKIAHQKLKFIEPSYIRLTLIRSEINEFFFNQKIHLTFSRPYNGGCKSLLLNSDSCSFNVFVIC